MESSVQDDKVFHHEEMRKAFGDDFNVVNCCKVENKEGKVLFCELLIDADKLNRSKLPDKVTIVMEV